MIDFTWKVFSQTGSIETYLILKELESEQQNIHSDQESDKLELDSNM